jgi:hypothetical protein
MSGKQPDAALLAMPQPQGQKRSQEPKHYFSNENFAQGR